MKKYFPLHIQILLALVAGAVFGSLFGVNPRVLNITYSSSRYETKVENWDRLKVSYSLRNDTNIIEKSFGMDAQVAVISYFNSIPASSSKSIDVYYGEKHRNLTDVILIEKPSTVATVIRPAGTIFINLLSFLAIPLVIASLIVGTASLGDIKKLGRIGIRTFFLFMVTTAIAITIGLALANIIEPGTKVSDYSKNRLIGEFDAEASQKKMQDMEIDVVDFIVDIVPRNPLKAMADGNMLQIVFFAVFFGITLTFIEKSKADPVVNFFSGVSDTMIRMVDIVMIIAPFGVFALISSTVAEFGISIISTLFWYILTVLLGLAMHMFTIYPFIVKVFGKMNPAKFFKGLRDAQLIAFSTSSSAATLPVTMKCVEENLGIPKQISGFVLPLGATVNMDGTALYQGVAAVFIAQVFGIELTLVQQLTILFTSVLASIGTAPVPGVGIIMLIMILQSVNIPPEGIALIIGVDRFLDMCRTVPNITGDSAVAVSIFGLEGKKSI